MDTLPTTRWAAPKSSMRRVAAHARRKFINAVKLNALDKESIGIVEKMDPLFRVDRVARERGLTLEARLRAGLKNGRASREAKAQSPINSLTFGAATSLSQPVSLAKGLFYHPQGFFSLTPSSHGNFGRPP